MGQASSVQRDPSMEEILASIRRIIEDSDAAPRSSPPVRRPAAEAAEEDEESPVLTAANSDVVSFRPSAPQEPESGEARREAGNEGPDADAPDADAPDAAASDDADLLPSGDLELPDDFAAGFEEFQAALDPAAFDAGGAPARIGPETGQVQTEKTPLLSSAVGRQVAASFEELSDAFAASRRKSIDEIAEDMLRPMLQEWLDDNLPTLVERLVREEIERIARGGGQ